MGLATLGKRGIVYSLIGLINSLKKHNMVSLCNFFSSKLPHYNYTEIIFKSTSWIFCLWIPACKFFCELYVYLFFQRSENVVGSPESRV